MFLKLLIFMLIFHINIIKSLQYEKSKIASFLGTAELLPNYRRSRIVKEIFNHENSQQNPENVFEINNDDNIKKKNYDQLISQTQPRKLSDKQQILLDQIVERVARLGGSYLLNNETEIKTNNNNNNNGGINNTNINNDEIEGRKNKIVKINNDTINYNINKKIDKQLVTTVKPQKITNKNQSNGNNNNDNIINNENNKINMTENIFSNINTSSIVDSLSLSDHAREDLYNQQFVTSDPIKNKKEPTAASAKPTKYHYYPHNQHIYLLPECAIQQVCNAVYVRLNFTQPLCACPARYRDPCSASINEDDLHTTKLIGDKHRKAITLAKTCESTTEMRECRSPRDWSLLALQNTRTGKSHYLVICRCPDHYRLEGPMAHDQPTYASVPGIRVFGMMCIKPGVTLRRPQIPPKREKPFYQQPQPQPQQQQYITISPNSQNFQQQQLYKQNQYQNNYQYTHRSDDGSAPITTTENGNIYQDDKPTTIQQFNSYGERQNKEEHSINEEDHTEQIQNNRNKRNVKLSSSSSTTYNSVEDNEISSEISWHKLKKLISDIQWD